MNSPFGVNPNSAYNKKNGLVQMAGGNFTPRETELLRKLFGKNPGGAKALLDAIKRGEKIQLPDGVTRSLLERYLELAEDSIRKGKDKIGTQELRKRAIELLLRAIPKVFPPVLIIIQPEPCNQNKTECHA
jgi:hypothetical protein